MSELVRPEQAPVFVIGTPWSGTSAVTGILHHAAGLSLGEFAPPTPDSRGGRFEAVGVVEAHRDILEQIDRDWTCPPPRVDPATIDLSYLAEQASIHRQLPAPWGVKDPRLMFMVRAWDAVGVGHVRFVGVLRPEADVIQSLVRREGFGQLEAESIVAAYLHRMFEIASLTDLPIVEFSSDAASVVDQTRRVASALGLAWDGSATTELFLPSLINNEVRMGDHTSTYFSLVEQSDLDRAVPACEIANLQFDSHHPEPLSLFIGPRNVGRRNELWNTTTFDLTVAPNVVEFIPLGAQPGRVSRPGVLLDVVELAHPLQAGDELRGSVPVNGVVASGLLDSLTIRDLEMFMNEMHLYTDQLAEVFLDIADAVEGVPVAWEETSRPRCSREEFVEAAQGAGWDLLFDRRLSPHRRGFKFRKRILTDPTLAPDIAALHAIVDRVNNLQQALRVDEERLLELQSALLQDGFNQQLDTDYVRSLVTRAASAERDLARLKNRRSVRLAIGMARPFKGVFRSIRRWR